MYLNVSELNWTLIPIFERSRERSGTRELSRTFHYQDRTFKKNRCEFGI